MPEFLTTEALLTQALAAFCIVNLVLLIGLKWSNSRQGAKDACRIHELEKKLQILMSGSIGVGHRMIALEKKLRSLENKQHSLEKSDTDFSYARAQMLIEQGVDVKTVSANSGLSSSEIDLMRMLHEHSRQSDVAVHA